MSNIALSVRNLKFHGMNAVREIERSENCYFSVFVFGANSISVNICLCGTRVNACRIGLFSIFGNGNREIHAVVNDSCIVGQFNGIRHSCRRIRNIAENRCFTVIDNRRIVNSYIVDEKRKFTRIRFCFIVFPSAVFNVPFNHGAVVAFRLVTVFRGGVGKAVVLHCHGIVAGESGKIGIEIVPTFAAHALAFNEELIHCG